MGIKALLVGINAYKAGPLNGCVNDIRGIREVLESQYGLKSGDTRMLLDRDATGAQITQGLAWLAEQAKAAETRTCLFYYSGHGSFTSDQNRDEPDGKDEAICPVDYDTKGLLIDDVLHKLYKSFKPSTHLVTVMDSCHSGDSWKAPLDSKATDIRAKFIAPPAEELARCREAALLYKAEKDAMVEDFVRQKLEGLKKSAGSPQAMQASIQTLVKEALLKFQKKSYGMVTATGNFVLIAGCRSDQTSADARFPEGYQGALSYYLLKALRAGGIPTYAALIEKVAEGLDSAGFEQIPQLECTRALRQTPFLHAVDKTSTSPRAYVDSETAAPH